MTATTVTSTSSGDVASARRLAHLGWKQAHDQTKARLLRESRSGGRAAAVRELADVADEWATVGPHKAAAAAGAARAMYEFGHMIAHDLEAESASRMVTIVFLVGCLPVAAWLGWMAG